MRKQKGGPALGLAFETITGSHAGYIAPSVWLPPVGPGAQAPKAGLTRLVGRGARIRGRAGSILLVIPLRGRVDVDTLDGRFQLSRRQVLALPGESLIQAGTHTSSDWLMLAVDPARLAEAARYALGRKLPEPILFPVPTTPSSLFLAHAVGLVRLASRPDVDPIDVSATLRHVLISAIHDQAPCNVWVERACGRTESHRRQVVARLLRARNRMSNAPFERHGVEELCCIARYSKSHFIRLFREVFGVTPHDYLSSVRIEMAKRLIAEGRLAITEIAGNVGFESRFAFARLFKQRVGVSAAQFRIQNQRLRQVA